MITIIIYKLFSVCYNIIKLKDKRYVFDNKVIYNIAIKTPKIMTIQITLIF